MSALQEYEIIKFMEFRFIYQNRLMQGNKGFERPKRFTKNDISCIVFMLVLVFVNKHHREEDN